MWYLQPHIHSKWGEPRRNTVKTRGGEGFFKEVKEREFDNCWWYKGAIREDE